MQKLLRHRAWISAQCLRKHKRARSTVAEPRAVEDRRSARTLNHDDTLLRNVFDGEPFWKDFSKSTQTSGTIGNYHLTSPRGFKDFAEAALGKCKILVEKTLAASTVEEFRAIPRDLDRLSDLLCRVIDLSDFIRAIHSDHRVVAAATGAYALMFQYMNELNTTTGLNKQLQKAFSIQEVSSHWNEEEKAVAKILLKDFSKSGVDLPLQQRADFVRLSNEISQIGTEFVTSMGPDTAGVTLSRDQLHGVDPTVVKTLGTWRKIQVPVYGSTARLVMSTAHDESARRDIYIGERTASKFSIGRLERLLLCRAELAKLTGYASYGSMTLADKMAKAPGAVNNFLTSLNTDNRGQLQREIAHLLEVKKNIDPGVSSLEAWDHSYLLNRLEQSQQSLIQRTSRSRLLEHLPSFFSVGSVISGLSELFNSLYGIRLVPSPVKIGETWDPEVRRLDAFNDFNEHIATMYCDLFSRPRKPPNPAHFTLVCSREISVTEVEESVSRKEPLNDGMPIYQTFDASTGCTRRYQIPIIALVCDFPASDRSSAEPTLLSLNSVTTLFHEMGHAVHSILGRTSMQGIAGTRCATDFAELPSVLMEYFATDRDVLGLFARHWQTDAPMPQDMIDAMHKEQQDRARRTGAWDNENQILMALLDQAFHSEATVQALQIGHFNSTQVYHDIWDRHGSVREPRETAWQGFFSHSYSYGSTYYAYLFDRAIARQVWRTVFNDGKSGGAIDRSSGERFKNEVLRWGGGRDPWTCLEGLMGEGRGVLAGGGEAAMREVGRWGVGAGNEGAM